MPSPNRQGTDFKESMSLDSPLTSRFIRFKIFVCCTWLTWALHCPKTAVLAAWRRPPSQGLVHLCLAFQMLPQGVQRCPDKSSGSGRAGCLHPCTASFLMTSSLMESSLGHLVASHSGTRNFSSHTLQVLFSIGFFSLKARLRKAVVDSWIG